MEVEGRPIIRLSVLSCAAGLSGTAKSNAVMTMGRPLMLMPYKTAGVHQSIQQAPSASFGDVAPDTLQPPRHGSRSNASSLRPPLVPTSTSLDILKSPRRSPSAIANADSIRSSSPRSYTPKGTPPRVPEGSLQSRNTCSRQNNPPLPDRPVITTTALSPSSSPPSLANL